MHVLDVGIDDQQRLVLTIESGQLEAACPRCGVVAVGHGRRVRMLHDAPCFGRVTVLRWLVRMWRCREPACPAGTFSEAHDVAPPRSTLTSRAAAWATSALSYDDTTVSALARHLGVDWHTAWDAIETEAKARTANPTRLKGVRTLGVDEHIWRPSRIGVDRAVTIMVDLSRDQDGCLHARLLDAVVGRSGSVYKAWLKAQPQGFIDGVEQAALDPFRGYANAIRDGLPDAVAVLDAFHVVRLGTQMLDEVRRRVQQDTLGRRGHKHDPLYKIRGLLRHGVEHLTDKQQAKIAHCLDAGDPDDEVNITWQCYQRLRSIYHAAPAKGRQIAAKVLDSFHTCPIPEVARLGRTLRAWRAQVLAYFDTSGVSNGGTEAINLIIEKVRRLAHGFKNFDHYRLRIMLAADGRRPYRSRPNHA
ncbi:MAG TPA: ISL3 family transposase [Propionibacteriaceae bacterium]|nr:ISL3 family transposase [Propionibacteriaceae bacterium]